MRPRTLFAALALLAGALPASASFDAQVVRADYLAPDDMTVVPDQIRPVETCVAPGVEFFSGQGGDPPAPEDQIAIDLSGGNILLSNVLGTDVTFSTGGMGPFNGFQLSDVGSTIPDITGVAINAATNLPGFTASLVTFDANSVRINLEGFLFQPSNVVSLDVSFAGPPPPPAAACSVPTLPKPGLALLVLGLGLAGFLLLRRALPGRS